jgi:hypothetical protein
LESMAKRGGVFPAPTRSSRPFLDDYPEGVPHETFADGGRIARDLKGSPLTARFIAGRRVVGGEDQALSAEELNILAEAATLRSPQVVARRELSGAHGQFRTRRVGDERQRAIFLADDLPPAALRQALVQ